MIPCSSFFCTYTKECNIFTIFRMDTPKRIFSTFSKGDNFSVSFRTSQRFKNGSSFKVNSFHLEGANSFF